MHVIIGTEKVGQRSLRVLQDLNKVPEDLSKILANVFVDLAKFPIKILKDLDEDPCKDSQEDPQGSLKILERFSPGTLR